MYPGMAKAAREEGFGKSPIGSRRWQGERSHANRFQKALDAI